MLTAVLAAVLVLLLHVDILAVMLLSTEDGGTFLKSEFYRPIEGCKVEQI